MYICWTKYQPSVDFSSHHEHFSSLATLATLVTLVHKQVPPQTIWQRQKSQIFLFLTQTLASPLERQRLLCLCLWVIRPWKVHLGCMVGLRKHTSHFPFSKRLRLK